jgi:hypothetical protein
LENLVERNLRRKEMKKRVIMLVALLAVVAIAVPAFALEFKYGGMYRLRWQSNDNLNDGGAEGFALDNTKNYLPFGRNPDSTTTPVGWPLGRADANDNQNYMDQRLRMYFSFVASENLQVVSKFEIDNIWGYQPDKFSGGGGVGADAINIEVKNVYVDFNIPYTPVRSTLGVQTVTLMTGWVIDDDFSAAKFSAKFDPITVTAGYISGLNSDVSTSYDNIDNWFISLDYAQGPFKASLLGFLQNGHDTNVSTFMNPRMATGSAGGGVGQDAANSFNLLGTNLAGGANGLSVIDPSGTRVSTLYPSMATSAIASTYTANLAQPGWFNLTGTPTATVDNTSTAAVDSTRVQSVLTTSASGVTTYWERNTAFTNTLTLPVAENNYLFDLGFNFEYKLDWIKAYINFVKNFGGFTYGPGWADQDIDYAGYMIDAGVNMYYGPFSFTVNGFLASGDNFSDDDNVDSDGNFRYPRGASHYWSEILGMGALDSILGGSNLNSVRATASSSNAKDTLSDSVKRLPGDYGWQGADTPSNLWMINVGAAYQALEKTKLTLNYYYIGTQQDVLSGTFYDPATRSWYGEYSKSIGHEVDFYVDQGIVDGLNLRLVFAYLWANDGYTIYTEDGNTWETGFVLQWNF